MPQYALTYNYEEASTNENATGENVYDSIDEAINSSLAHFCISLSGTILVAETDSSTKASNEPNSPCFRIEYIDQRPVIYGPMEEEITLALRQLTLARNSLATEKDLDRIAKGKYLPILLAVSKNPKTTSGTLYRIASKDFINNIVRCSIARHPNVDYRTLKLLVQTGNDSVKETVANSKNATLDLLDILSEEDNENISIAVVNNPNITPEIIKMLIKKKKNRKLLKNIARSRNTPLDLLEEMMMIKDDEIRSSIALNSNASELMLESLARLNIPIINASVARNQNSHQATLRRLFEKNINDINLSLAGNPRTPDDILDKLANNKEVYVRLFVADNPSTNSVSLSRLSQDTDEQVAGIAKLNQNYIQRGTLYLTNKEDMSHVAEDKGRSKDRENGNGIKTHGVDRTK